MDNFQRVIGGLRLSRKVFLKYNLHTTLKGNTGKNLYGRVSQNSHVESYTEVLT